MSLFFMDLSCQYVTRAVGGHILCRLEDPGGEDHGSAWPGPAPSCSLCGNHKHPFWSGTSLREAPAGLTVLVPCRWPCPEPFDAP